MNKLIVDEYLKIKENSDLLLKINKDDLNLEIDKDIDVIITMNESNTKNINIYIKENSSLTLNLLMIDDSSNIIVNLDGENSKLQLHYSSINYNKQNYKITVNHNKSKTISNIINHGISVEGNKIIFDVNGVIPKTSEECICNQDNKIINIKDSESIIKPNLYIDNYNVEANHQAYIGNFKKDDMFYLMSRGINKKDCRFLLLKSFLLNKMNLNEEIESKYIEEIYKI